MSTFNEFHKIFKHAVSGVDAISKYMDEKFEPYSDSVIDAVNEFNGVVIISTNDDKKRFKELLAEKFKIFFENNTLRISKPKLEGNKRPTTAYASFVRAERKRFMEEFGLKDSDPESFAKIGTILGKEWSKLSSEQKEKYKKLAAEETEARGVKKTEKVENPKTEKKVAKKEEKKPEKKENKKEEKKVEKKETKKKEVKKTEKNICEHDDCTTSVRGEPIDGKYLCSAHKPKTKKKVEKKEEKKEEKKQIIEDEEIDYDLEYFECEPVSTDDDAWRGDNIKKIKDTNMYYQKESRIAFEIDKDGFYIFKGMNINKVFIDHAKEDIPEVILDWARNSDLSVASK